MTCLRLPSPILLALICLTPRVALFVVENLAIYRGINYIGVERRTVFLKKDRLARGTANVAIFQTFYHFVYELYEVPTKEPVLTIINFE